MSALEHLERLLHLFRGIPAVTKPVRAAIAALEVDRDSATLYRAEARKLSDLLGKVLDAHNDIAHDHRHPGRWDGFGGVTVAGSACRRCHVFADARGALGRPRWPAAEDRRADVRDVVCGEGCGCGAPPLSVGRAELVDAGTGVRS